jgi:beta-fructofuranosidase
VATTRGVTGADTDRPRLHFAPRNGWLNDPLALTWRAGEHEDRYHLFFQHVPDGAEWAAHCRWGRATSGDLLTWEEQPVALEPSPDELGAWSGCLAGETIFYTSVVAADVERGRVRVATPTADIWARWEQGEVVVPPPDDPGVSTFRDPFVLRDGDTWRMLVGAGLADGTGCVLGYISTDLRRWAYDGVVASRHTAETEPVWTGAIWECPQLVRLPEADVLVISPADADRPGDIVAGVGALRKGRFEVASWQRLTAGAPYAGSVFRDREDRPGLVTWLRGVTGKGWAGAVSVPLLLSLEGGRVRLHPHPALEDRRGSWEPGAPAWEVEWEMAGELTLVDDLGEPVAWLRAPEAGGLHVSVGDHHLHLDAGTGPARLLRDGPVLEVVADGLLAATSIPTGPARPQGSGWRGWSLA